VISFPMMPDEHSFVSFSVLFTPFGGYLPSSRPSHP
jgi:hypothetical protein